MFQRKIILLLGNNEIKFRQTVVNRENNALLNKKRNKAVTNIANMYYLTKKIVQNKKKTNQVESQENYESTQTLNTETNAAKYQNFLF